MSVTITLHIYSGRPDPSWELSDTDATELANRISSIQQVTRLKPAGMSGMLGYKGFSIVSVRERRFEPHIYLHEGIVDSDRFDINRIEDSPEIEKWLLSTAGNAVSDDIKSVVTTALGSGIAHPLTSFTASFVPPYDPGKWNNDPNIRARNNCYNYANDKITNTFAQPGRGSGLMYTSMDCGNVGAAAARDGQVATTNPASTPSQGHFIALVIWPGNDFHWYRLDANAQWSHKPGQTPVRNVDNSGAVITNPQTCDRGPYINFCSFYHCIPSATKVQ